MVQKSLVIAARKVDIVYRKARGLRSSVRLKNGKVVLSLSPYLLGRRREQTIEKFLDWARERLEGVSGDFVLPEYVDGGVIVTHNKVYRIELKFVDRSNVMAKCFDGALRLFLPFGYEFSDGELQDRIEKLIMKDQYSYLEEVLNELNQMYFQEEVNAIRFKRTTSRFGSCSSKRNINISFRLLFAPREVFRYVCVHELAHLKEMNHSKKFWAWVESAMPDYKLHEKWLRKNGFMLG